MRILTMLVSLSFVYASVLLPEELQDTSQSPTTKIMKKRIYCFVFDCFLPKNMQDKLHDIVAKIKKIEIQIRRAVANQWKGDYRSVFKGTGLTFSELREYRYGDDVRYIDWMASAKGHGIFIKEYKEERELSLYVVLDMSASMLYPSLLKWHCARELAAALMWMGLRERCEVNLMGVQDNNLFFLPSLRKHQLLMSAIQRLWHQMPNTQSDKPYSWLALRSRIRRYALAIIISDFILPESNIYTLSHLANYCDLYLIHLFDESHYQLPLWGPAMVADLEGTVRHLWVGHRASASYHNLFLSRKMALQAVRKQAAKGLAHIHFRQPYVPALVDMFMQAK